MALSDIFNLVAAQLPPTFGTNSVPLVSAYEPKFLWKQGTPCRAVWVPTHDTYEAPDPLFPGFTTQGPTPPADRFRGIEPRCIYTRVVNADVHLWGSSYDETEALIETFLATMWAGNKASLWGAFEVPGGHWLSTDGREISQLGVVYVLQLSFRTPIRLPAKATAPVTSVPDPTRQFGS
jgi:hypothetical protein